MASKMYTVGEYNLQPKRIAVAVRWACQKIGEEWREKNPQVPVAGK